MRRHVVLMFIVWTQTFLTRKHVFVNCKHVFIVLKHKIIACKFQNFQKMVTWFVLKRTLRTVSVVMDTRMRTTAMWIPFDADVQSPGARCCCLPWAAGTRLLYTPRSHYISSRHLTHPTIMCCDTHTDPYPCSRSGWRGHTWLVSISPSEHTPTSCSTITCRSFYLEDNAGAFMRASSCRWSLCGDAVNCMTLSEKSEYHVWAPLALFKRVLTIKWWKEKIQKPNIQELEICGCVRLSVCVCVCVFIWDV